MFDYADWQCRAPWAMVVFARMEWQAVERQEALCKRCGELHGEMLCDGIRRAYLPEASDSLGVPRFGSVPCDKRLGLESVAARLSLLKQCGLSSRLETVDWTGWIDGIMLGVTETFVAAQKQRKQGTLPSEEYPSTRNYTEGKDISFTAFKEKAFVFEREKTEKRARARGEFSVAEVLRNVGALHLRVGVQETEAMMAATLAAAWVWGMDAVHVNLREARLLDAGEDWSGVVRNLLEVQYAAVVAWDADLGVAQREEELVGVLEARLAAGEATWLQDSGESPGRHGCVERLRGELASVPWAAVMGKNPP